MRLDLDGFTEAEVLGYVMAGLVARHAAIEAKIAYLEGELNDARATPAKRGRKPTPVAAKPRQAKVAKAKTGKRTLSAEARQRIAEGQHRRWAAAKKKAKVRVPKVKLAEPETTPIEEMALAEVG